MSSRFYFGASDDSASDLSDGENDRSSLPFPAPLSRSAFLEPNFDPADYLSSLTSRPRFQTLDDLHAELKTLSQNLNKELVDLVNDNYEDFLKLGENLRGGEEKVEQVRVGMLGFERDVRGVRDCVQNRAEEVRGLMGQLREVRRQITIGKSLLEVEERIAILEERLKLSATIAGRAMLNKFETREAGDFAGFLDQEDQLDSGDSDEETEHGSLRPRLQPRVEDFLIVRVLISKLGQEHPFVVGQRDRVTKIRAALLLDLETALKEAVDDSLRKKIVRLRISMDEDLSSTAKS